MKYIRTKDNRIIDTTKYYIENSNLFKNGAYQEYKKELANAYKQADTIEELCDWFVLKEDNKIRVLYDSLDNAINCEGNDILRYEIIGAIETDKGLIYVAKMNEKGELELL